MLLNGIHTLIEKLGQLRQPKRRRPARWQGASGVERLESRDLLSVDLAGNTLALARDIGRLNGTQVMVDTVDRTDPADWYRLRLDGRSDFRLSLGNLAADVDVRLRTQQGILITGSTNGGTQSESIQRELEPGTYFVEVYPYGNAQSSYRLTLSATLLAPPVPDGAGNSLATARDLGALNGSTVFNDFVGRADTNDYLRFQLTNRSNFTLQLNGLSADADVQLLGGNGSVIASSTQGGSSSESLQRTLDSGTYFIRVYPYGNAETNYRLTASASPVNPPVADHAGNTMAAALNLGSLNGTVWLSDFVGQADRNDFYRFHLDRRSNFHLELNGLSADADVYLRNAQGQIIASSTRGGTSADVIDRVFESGDFFAEVIPYGSANTTYALTLSVTPQGPQGLDVSTVSPLADYDGHLGADYPANAGTAVLSPVSGRVIDVRPVNGYGTMAVAVEVTLPSYRTFASESGGTVTTDRVIMIFGHLRPSQALIANSSAQVRFNQGQNELGYNIGDTISVGQRLGYIETHGYEGSSTGSHVHVSAMDARQRPANIWQGRGAPANDPIRRVFIRPELAWALLR